MNKKKSFPQNYLQLCSPEFQGLSLPEFRDEAKLFFDAGISGKIPLDVILKNGKSTIAGISGDFFVKQYKYRGIFYALCHLFLKKRTAVVLQGAHFLKTHDISTPQVLAVCNYRRFGLFAGGMVLTELTPADTVWSNSELEMLTEAGRENFAAGLAGLLAKLHQCGFIHDDFNLRNIYCRKENENSYCSWGVIDLDSCRWQKKPVSLPDRRAEMARLLSSIKKSVYFQKLDLPDMSSTILAEYHRITGIDLAGEKLDKRIDYLIMRNRKKQR